MPSSHAPRREFAAAAELERKLRASLRGDVSFDPGSRAMYATDASNYREVPIGVVLPRDVADVEATLAACRAFDAPVLPRGAGTSLAGQACNVAVVLDFSKYMNRLLELDPHARRARVQPGIVLDRLRDAAEAHQLTFAPDPATHSRCTLGGMIGNNSCGVHALMGGKTVDNIEVLEVLLYDGTRLRLGATSPDELSQAMGGGGRGGGLHTGLAQLTESYAPLVRARFPDIPRRVSGYNLDQLLPENGFHLARALVGSEGTCATVIEATVTLKPSPPHRCLVAVGFGDAFIAADHVPGVLTFAPIGLEGIDGLLLDLVAAQPHLRPHAALLPAGRGFLLVEFGGWASGEAEAQAAVLIAAVTGWPAHPSVRVYTQSEARRVWHVRESALGVTAFPPGRAPGYEGWEDAAVAPEKLGSYLRGLDALLTEYGYQAPMYGHFGQGCVHFRINFDFETEPGILAFREFLDRATDLVVAHGGSISGEHGDGQARGALLPRMFGPELMDAFRQFKRLWDPDNRMNPGKLIDARQPHESLRLGADYRPWQPATHFQFAAGGGSFAHAAGRCIGVGACRKTDAGVMCPSYMATRDEKHSTRGRAHMLWELMQNEVLEGGWKSDEVKSALDLCLACKACKTECPAGVDLATYKAEFLSHYYEDRRRPLTAHLFGRMDQWARLMSHAPALAGLAEKLKTLTGIHRERPLPRPQPPFNRQWSPSAISGTPVLLWADTVDNYFQPRVLAAAANVLSRAGFSVRLPQRHLCCGRPFYDFGMLNEARRYLLRTLDALAPDLAAGVPVVVLEPSCASVFRDELTQLLPSDPRASQLRDQTFLLSEFLLRYAPEYRPVPRRGRILVHGHCHQRAIMGMDSVLDCLRLTGAEIDLLDSGCCGLAGPFGYEKDKYEISRSIGERVLAPAVRAATPDTVIVTDGFSCRQQIEHLTGRRAVHIAEVL